MLSTKPSLLKQSMSLFLALLISCVAQADRIKDMASIAGVRSNALIGYGLVVGLDGFGDQTSQTPFTTQFNCINKKHIKIIVIVKKILK